MLYSVLGALYCGFSETQQSCRGIVSMFTVQCKLLQSPEFRARHYIKAAIESDTDFAISHLSHPEISRNAKYKMKLNLARDFRITEGLLMNVKFAKKDFHGKTFSKSTRPPIFTRYFFSKNEKNI